MFIKKSTFLSLPLLFSSLCAVSFASPLQRTRTLNSDDHNNNPIVHTSSAGQVRIGTASNLQGALPQAITQRTHHRSPGQASASGSSSSSSSSSVDEGIDIPSPLWCGLGKDYVSIFMWMMDDSFELTQDDINDAFCAGIFEEKFEFVKSMLKNNLKPSPKCINSVMTVSASANYKETVKWMLQHSLIPDQETLGFIYCEALFSGNNTFKRLFGAHLSEDTVTDYNNFHEQFVRQSNNARPLSNAEESEVLNQSLQSLEITPQPEEDKERLENYLAKDQTEQTINSEDIWQVGNEMKRWAILNKGQPQNTETMREFLRERLHLSDEKLNLIYKEMGLL